MNRARTGVALLAAAILIGTACESSSEPDRPAVTVLVSGDPQELEVYRSIVDAYEAAGGGPIGLLEVAERDELIARLATSIGTGDPPDLFLLNYRYYGQFLAAGALEPLGPYLDTSTVFEERDLYPQAVDAFRDDGVVICLPQNISSLVVYYNESLLEEANVPVPTDDWSWAEMVTAAKTATRDTDGDGAIDVYGLGVDPEIIRVAPLVWSAGGELVDDEAHPTRFSISNLAGLRAFRAFLDLRAREVTPTDAEAEAEDFESRFLGGRLAMLIESRRVVPALRTITSFGWDVAPLPPLEEPANVLHSDAYCMTADSGAKGDAWSFVEFALGPTGQRIAAEAGRTVPSLIDVANSKAFLDPSREPSRSGVFLDAIPHIHALPHVSTWPEIEDVTNGLLEEAYYEQVAALEVGELIRSIAVETRPVFARAR